MSAGPSPIGTVLDELVQALDRASAYNPQDQVAPAAVLWTDKDRQWEAVIPRLLEARPGLLALGPYVPEERSGPAIWLRCMLERTLSEADWPEETVPVLYLPGVSRRDLRAVAECPRELRPLAEVQYRGVWFTQENTRDWSLFAFLTSKHGGLGLDVAGDEATRATLQHTLTKLLETSVAEVRGRRLQAADFQALLQPDLVKQLLRWLDAPDLTRRGWSAEEWHSFRGACRERYGFDPENDGDLVGAEKLGTQEGSWGTVWARFAEAPAAYANLPDLLRRAKPAHEEKPLFFHAECWPQCNEDAEAELREKITALSSLGPESARSKILDLERRHALRRTWVWARLGRARLAQALEHLAFLARAASKKIRGADAAALATSYVDEGWQSDAAVLEALAIVSSAADVAAVHAAIQAIYKPWLEEAAERFQDLVREKSPGNPGRGRTSSPRSVWAPVSFSQTDSAWISVSVCAPPWKQRDTSSRRPGASFPFPRLRRPRSRWRPQLQTSLLATERGASSSNPPSARVASRSRSNGSASYSAAAASRIFAGRTGVILPVALGRSTARSTSAVTRKDGNWRAGSLRRSMASQTGSGISLMRAGTRFRSSPTMAGSCFPAAFRRWTCHTTL